MMTKQHVITGALVRAILQAVLIHVTYLSIIAHDSVKKMAAAGAETHVCIILNVSAISAITVIALLIRAVLRCLEVKV